MMPSIRFETTLSQIGSKIILRLPENASMKLPSRGMVLIEGTIDNCIFRAVLEPDGRGSHWFYPDNNLIDSAHVSAGDIVDVTIEPSRKWPEPSVPRDLRDALVATQKAHELWKDITPMARWEWIRWIRSTKSSSTRQRRISAACDKLMKGERRPCCFNRSLCTEPDVSRNGVLIDLP